MTLEAVVVALMCLLLMSVSIEFRSINSHQRKFEKLASLGWLKGR